MSEHLKHTPENASEKLDLSAEIERNLKRAELEAKNVSGEKIDTAELKHAVEQQAISSKELSIDEPETAPPAQEFGAYTEMKSQTYQRALGRIRSRLSAPEKTASKIMHAPTVDSASNFLGKTLARPSGILGGGIAALLGSSILIYMAKKYGFEYNFFLFFVLLAVGFLLGVLAELLLRIIRKK